MLGHACSRAHCVQVQQELYDSGRSSQAGRLLQGMLGAPECGLRLFKVSVAVWLPQASLSNACQMHGSSHQHSRAAASADALGVAPMQAAVKAVSASRRACLRSAFAAAAGVKDVHVQLDSVRQSTLRPSKTYDAPISKPRHLQGVGLSRPRVSATGLMPTLCCIEHG